MSEITEIERALKKNKKLLTLSVIVLVLLLVASQFAQSLSTVNYSTAYEGAKAKFIGAKDLYTDRVYTSSQKYSASVAQFDTSLNFDIDDADKYMCNIAGEMTSVFIPQTDASMTKDWVPTSWWRDAMLWQNPQKVYSWTTKNSDGTTSVYRMEEWLTKWFVTLSAEWDSGPDVMSQVDEAQNRRYSNIELWFEFDIAPSWYFEGTDKAYFAIAKVQLSDIAYNEKWNDQSTHPATSDTIRVNPASPGSVLTIFHNQFGEELATDKESFEAYYYEKTKLNPLYFRDKVYSKITLNDFGTTDWYEGLTWLRAKGDAVTFGFTVTQFVVGEWLVQDVQEVPTEYGRESKVGEAGWSGFADMFGFLSSPLGQMWLFLILIGIVLVAITFLFPGFWVLVFGLFGRRKKEKNN